MAKLYQRENYYMIILIKSLVNMINVGKVLKLNMMKTWMKTLMIKYFHKYFHNNYIN